MHYPKVLERVDSPEQIYLFHRSFSLGAPDRGFTVHEEVWFRQVELNIPAFTKGKNQLDPLDVEKTRKISVFTWNVSLASSDRSIQFFKAHYLQTFSRAIRKTKSL